MKTFCKTSALSFGLCLLLFAIPLQSEAQFLKKINKGLEKVNKGLGEFNKKMDNLNQAAAKKSEKKSTQSAEKSQQSTEKGEQAAEKKAVPVHVDHTQAEPKKTNTSSLELQKFFRGNTHYMKVRNRHDVSEAYEGIFAVSEKPATPSGA